MRRNWLQRTYLLRLWIHLQVLERVVLSVLVNSSAVGRLLVIGFDVVFFENRMVTALLLLRRRDARDPAVNLDMDVESGESASISLG